jgi:hypothetical protein
LGDFQGVIRGRSRGVVRALLDVAIVLWDNNIGGLSHIFIPFSPSFLPALPGRHFVAFAAFAGTFARLQEEYPIIFFSHSLHQM